MLVLSRRLNETIIAESPDGTRVEFKILALRGDKVRIGVTAPRNITVHREEVFQAIEQERETTPAA